MLLISAKGYNQLGYVLRNTVRSFSAKPQSSSSNNKQSKIDFEYCVDLVQNRDRESYLCGLLMPSSSRQSYFAIKALNVELASIKDGSVSRKAGGAQFEESGASMALKIRMQWWREALNQIYGDAPVSTEDTASQDFVASMAHSSWKNPVVRVLNQAVHESNLTRRFLERLLEAREADLDISQAESMDDAILYSENTFSSLLYLSLETTNVREEAADVAAYHAGIGMGLVTALRGSTFRLARGECSIPKELLPGFPYHKFNSNDPKAELTQDEYAILTEAIRHMAYVASSHLSTARDIQRDIPKHAKPCFLPVVPVLHYLSKLEKSKYDIFDPVLLEADRLTVMALLSRTWLTGVF